MDMHVAVFIVVVQGPEDVAALSPLPLCDGCRVHEYRHHEEGGGGPRRQRHAPGDDGGPEPGARDGVAHGNVPVGRHDRQEDARRELVDRRRRQVDLAHRHPEDPVAVH